MSESKATPDTASTDLPTSPQDLIGRLELLGIATTSFTHAPVFTVEEAKALRGELPGAHIKNLFLRNKKGRMWLLTCLEDRPIDLKRLGEALGSGRLSFGSAERLRRYLGVEPGSVTPFAVINDRDAEVQMILDRDLVEPQILNAHPLVNSMTTSIAAVDLLRFLEAERHPPRLLDMAEVAKPEAARDS